MSLHGKVRKGPNVQIAKRETLHETREFFVPHATNGWLYKLTKVFQRRLASPRSLNRDTIFYLSYVHIRMCYGDIPLCKTRIFTSLTAIVRSSHITRYEKSNSKIG